MPAADLLRYLSVTAFSPPETAKSDEQTCRRLETARTISAENMLRQFILVWVIYWVSVAILPVHSIYPSTTEAFLLQAGFVLIVAVSAKVVLDIFRFKKMPEADCQKIPYAGTLIWIAILMSVVGLAALTYDKIFIQKIDYSAGIAFAREEWRRLGEDREGQASSIFSILGYLMGSAYYVAVVLAITQGAFISTRSRLLALQSSFVLLIANSLLTGGRSNVLLIATFVAAALSSRRGISLKSLFASRRQRRMLRGLIVASAAYSLFVFFQRANAFELGAVKYAIDFLPYLGVEADSWYSKSLGDSAFSSMSAIAVLAGSYLTHSFATVAAIIDTPTEDKSMIFLNFSQILYKLGAVSQPDDSWFLAGRFPSFPGALWHQLGPVGFVSGSVVLGILSGAVRVWVSRRTGQLLPLAAYTMTTSTLLLTPALFAPDFLSFPFVAAAFVMLAFVAKLIKSARTQARTYSDGDKSDPVGVPANS